MKILETRKIKEYFERCEKNLHNNQINEYIGLVFKPQEEILIQKELKEVGVPEFQSAPYPSLYIDIDSYTQTPYNKNIHLDSIQGTHFKYEYEMMEPNVLYNVEAVQNDPKRELNDYLILRAFNKPFSSTVLKQDGVYWMSDTPQEANTIDPCALKAKGHVLTFGLGIGYFVYMALLNEDVEDITIIEQSESVIHMFMECLYPQFPHKDKIHIIQGNAFDYFKEEYIQSYTYTFVDIWMNNEDGYEIMEKLLEQYLPKEGEVDFWIEASIEEFLHEMIYVYYRNIAIDSKPDHSNPFYHKLYRKIDTYFSSIDETFKDVETLKKYMYDSHILREIISTKVVL